MVLILTRTISILLRGVPFSTFVTIVMHMASAAFPAVEGDCLIVKRHLVQLRIFAYFRSR